MGTSIRRRRALVVVAAAAVTGAASRAGSALVILRDDLIVRASPAPLRAASPIDGDRFGADVALDGTTLLVGAPGRNSGQGTATSFVQTGAGTFLTRRELFAAVRAAGDAFGSAVAVSGDTAVIGAPGRSGDAGAAYVFTRTATNWSERAILTPSGAAAGDRFGASVAIAGGTILVGAPGRASGAGAAFVFTGADAVWTEQAALTAPGAAAGDAFGASVGLSADTAAVGAPSRADGVGAAFVYTRAAGTWTLASSLASDLPGAGRFGSAIDADGDRVVVGAPFQFDGNESGAAHVFARSGGAFVREDVIASPSRFGATIGWSVDLAGDRLALGAPSANTLLGDGEAGAVLIAERIGGRWTGLGALVNGPDDDYGGVAYFGSAVAISATAVVAGGAPSASYPGSAWPLASRPPAFTAGPLATPSPAGVLDLLHFTASAADPDGDDVRLVWTIGAGTHEGGDVALRFLHPGTIDATVAATDGVVAAVAATSATVTGVTGGAANVAFTESYLRKPRKVRTGEGRELTEVDDAKVALAGTLDLPNFDPAVLAASDEFRIVLGEFAIVAPLGADPKWRPGRTKVRIKDAAGTIALDWTKGRLAFSVKSVTVRRDAVLAGTAVAAEFVGAPTGPATGSVSGAVIFGRDAAALARPFTAAVTTSTKPAPGGGELVTSSVKVTGRE